MINANPVPTCPPASGAPRRGFTVIEVVVCMAIMTIIMAAIGSTIALASKAIPTGRTGSEAASSAAQSLDQMTGELRYATSVTEMNPTAVTFTLAPRGTDTQPETVRYAWTGTPGDPITRQYNGGAATAVVPAAKSFGLIYTKRKVTATQVTQSTFDSGSVLLSTFNGWLGLLGSTTQWGLTSANWCSEYFLVDQVTLPANTSSLTISKVRLKLKRPAAAGGATMTVGIYPPSAPGGPIAGTTPIGTPATITCASLGTTFAWVDIPFTDVVVNGPTTQLVIVVKGSGTTCAYVSYLNLLVAPADHSMMLWTTSSGTGWLPASGRDANDVQYEVWGSYQYPTTATASVDTYYLTGVGLWAQNTGRGGGTYDRLETAARVLNEPVVTGP
jgi:prepilin-type N-terminal cleavage/methylation domain-containing protein